MVGQIREVMSEAQFGVWYITVIWQGVGIVRLYELQGPESEGYVLAVFLLCFVLVRIFFVNRQ